MSEAAVVGVGMIRFGKLLEKGIKDLVREAAEDAIRDAGIEIKDINATIDLLSKLAGQFNEDLSVSLAMKFQKPAKVDQDLTDSIGEFSAIKTELSFNALVEK